MRVVLVEPLGQDFKPSLNTKGNSLEPVALECLAAYVDEHAPKGVYELTVIQQRDDLSDRDLQNMIVRLRPDVLGISMLTPYFSRCRALARSIKRKREETLVVVGGQHPSICPDVALEPEFDVAVVGEGEVTFLELLEAWRRYVEGSPRDGLNKRAIPHALVGVPGIAYSLDGKLQLEHPRPRIRDLDSLPWPRREKHLLMDCRQWNISYPAPPEQRTAQVTWSRGCHGRCSFCVSPLVWSGDKGFCEVFSRSAGSVVEEMLYLRDALGVNYVYFNDLSFNSPAGGSEALLSLCKEMTERGIHNGQEDEPHHVNRSIHWFGLCKVGISKAEAAAMSSAGCTKVGIGIESFAEESRVDLNKGYGLQRSLAKDTLENTDEVGILNRAYIILGSPHDPSNLVDTTVENLLSMPVDQVRLAFFTPYPGTSSWQACKDVLTTKDFDLFTQEQPIVRCKGFPDIEDLSRVQLDISCGFYGSEEYRLRCVDKVRRFPHLADSYIWHLQELEMQFMRQGVQSIQYDETIRAIRTLKEASTK